MNGLRNPAASHTVPHLDTEVPAASGDLSLLSLEAQDTASQERGDTWLGLPRRRVPEGKVGAPRTAGAPSMTHGDEVQR